MLSVFAAIVRRLKQGMEGEVPKVLAAVFEPTLQVGCDAGWGTEGIAWCVGLVCW